jgi:hypothetical protein
VPDYRAQAIENVTSATDDWLLELEGNLDVAHAHHERHHEDFLKAHEAHIKAVEELHTTIDEHVGAVTAFKTARFAIVAPVNRALIDGNEPAAPLEPQDDTGVPQLALLEPRKKFEQAHVAVKDVHAQLDDALLKHTEHEHSFADDEETMHLVHELDAALHEAIMALHDLLTSHGTVKALYDSLEEIHTALLKEAAFVTGFEQVNDMDALQAVLVKLRG